MVAVYNMARIFQLDILGPSVIAPNVAPRAIPSVFFSNDVQNGNAAWCQGTARGLRKAMGEFTSGRQKDMSDEAIVMEPGGRKGSLAEAHQNKPFLIDPGQLLDLMQGVKRFTGAHLHSVINSATYSPAAIDFSARA